MHATLCFSELSQQEFDKHDGLLDRIKRDIQRTLYALYYYRGSYFNERLIIRMVMLNDGYSSNARLSLKRQYWLTYQSSYFILELIGYCKRTQI